MRLIRLFVVSSAILLLLTGGAKLVSAMGHSEILDTLDPVFAIEYRILFLLTGAVELFVALICLFSKWNWLSLGLLASLSLSLVVYRVGIIYVGAHKPCNCLGSLTDYLHLSTEFADSIMKTVLGYLLLGSCGAATWAIWINSRLGSCVRAQDLS